ARQLARQLSAVLLNDVGCETECFPDLFESQGESGERGPREVADQLLRTAGIKLGLDEGEFRQDRTQRRGPAGGGQTSRQRTERIPLPLVRRSRHGALPAVERRLHPASV